MNWKQTSGFLSYQKNHYLINYDENKPKQDAYRKSIREKLNNRFKERYHSEPNFKIAQNLRNRVSRSVKSGSAVRDLGCSIEEFRLYLESKFQPGMNWENHGKWHIDHILPLSKFDLTNREQFLKACHYTNLQPLWAKDNIIKSNKLSPVDIIDTDGDLR